ncbi:MAG: type II and III secretion system protein, partial [Betaproteobacteria bacterium]|nr:type II and III secretion system protein [Betaproteobacteria bacterium]
MRPIGLTTASVAAALALGLAGCGLTPAKLSPTHITAASAPAERGTIPPPVQLAPVLPKPTPTTPPETYSVVVSNVRVQDLLFALARDAKLNVDINSDVTGTVTMNAVDQTLPQLLSRIADQVDMRYEVKGSDLVVMRDTPYLHIYHVDYVNLSRDAKSVNNLSTQVINTGAGTAGGAASSGTSNSTSTINSVSDNKFWATLVDNVKAILQETRSAEPVPVVP